MPRERVTSLSPEDLEDLFLLAPRIFCDYRDPTRGPLEMLFIFGQTSDNADSCFVRAVELAKMGATKALGISDGDLGHGYDGFDSSVDRLKQLGWGHGGVFPPIVKFDLNANVNTRSEALALAEWTKEHPGDIGVVATQFWHIVRGLTTLVTVLKGLPTHVYAYPGISMPWGERVRHSQGTVTNTRVGLQPGELQRMEKYQAPEFGGLFTAKQVIEYLNWRDEIPA